jgi:hypothetical protein
MNPSQAINFAPAPECQNCRIVGACRARRAGQAYAGGNDGVASQFADAERASKRSYDLDASTAVIVRAGLPCRAGQFYAGRNDGVAG